MKMVILEVAGDYAAALSEDGTISRIPNQNYRVGQQLMRPVQKPKNRFMIYAKRIAAVAAVFVFMLTGIHLYLQMPVSYVSLDVNPSVEYKLNLFNKVVEVVAINQDAKDLLKDAALVNQSADEAIKQTVALLCEGNYLTAEEKNDIVISASATDTKKSKAVLTTVTKATLEATESNGVEVDIIAFESSASDVKQAEKLGTTPGKMLLVNRVTEKDVTTIDPELDDMEEVNALLQAPVKELVSNMSEPALMQIREENESIVYIASNSSESVSSESSSLLMEELLPSLVSKDTASSSTESIRETTSCVENSSEVIPSDVASKTASETSSATDSSIAEETSSEETMDTSEIPLVNPGLTPSTSEETETSSKPENSLSTTTTSESTSSEELDVGEIPSVTPGIGVGDTSDADFEAEEPENSLDITTSVPEESLSDEKTVFETEQQESSITEQDLVAPTLSESDDAKDLV